MAWGTHVRPSKHNHAGHMIFEENQCFCDSCGQTWALDRSYDKMGKQLATWRPLPMRA